MKKKTIIREIRKIVDEQGFIKISMVDGAECPILTKQSKDTEILIESMLLSGVGCVEYVHGIEVNSFSLGYEDLTKDQLYDLLRIAEDYETDNEKTWKRCQS